MTYLDDLGNLVRVQDDSTVSRTVVRSEAVRVVVFAFDAGQVLTEHTASVPAILQVLDGRLRVTADGRAVDLEPGGLIHLQARCPHSVEAVSRARLALTLVGAPQGAG